MSTFGSFQLLTVLSLSVQLKICEYNIQKMKNVATLFNFNRLIYWKSDN